MDNIWLDKIKEIDFDNEVEILEEHKDKIVGVAEHFLDRMIPLYKGVNYFDKDDINAPILSFGARKCDGFEDCHCGYMVGPFGKNNSKRTIMVFDKTKMFNKMIQEYTDSGEEEDEDYPFYLMATEYYEYNIVGAYMDGVPAFAVFDPDEY
jgi:hypothetical protein